ncbi:hypothetical protein ANCDUO_24843, partial [Ancylostoma duodenale]
LAFSSFECFIITGGKKWGDRGHYVLPTVLAEVDESTTLAREEVIGPIMKVIRFETMEDLLQKTSVKHNFLPTAIMTRDADKVNHIAKKLRHGAIWNKWCNVRNGSNTIHKLDTFNTRNSIKI